MWRLHKTRMDSLAHLCANVLQDNVDKYPRGTWLEMLRVASLYQLRNLKSELADIIARNFSTVYTAPQLVHLLLDDIYDLLWKYEFHVWDERHTLSAVLKWIHHNEQQRMQHVKKLLSHIRLAVIDFTEEELKQLREDSVFCTEDGKRLLDEALRYRNSPADRWWMRRRGVTPRPGSTIQHMLGVVTFGETFARSEEDFSWISIKNKFITHDGTSLDPESIWKLCLDAVCYGDDLYLAVWGDMRRVFHCGDFPSGIWHEMDDLPADGQERSLIATPGYLYILGVSAAGRTTMYRLKLPSGKWEKVPALNENVSFGCCFYFNNQIYLFEKKVLFGCKECPGAVRGLFVFDLATETWKNLDDPRLDKKKASDGTEKIEDNDSGSEEEYGFSGRKRPKPRVKHICIEIQRPACVEGRVILNMHGGVCYYDPAKHEFERDDWCLYGARSAVCITNCVAYLDCGYVLGMGVGMAKPTEWHHLPIFDGELVVMDITDSQFENAMQQAEEDDRLDFVNPEDNSDSENGQGCATH